jgi:predicted nucleic-acid-binding Zn-ribbon protein
MTETKGFDFREKAALVEKSFPGLKCLRCRSENFYLLEGAPQPALPNTLVLVCMRCGMVEHHAADILREMTEPVQGNENE